MSVPGVWSEGRWLVEPETGRRLLVVAELEPGEHAPVSPGPSGRPPLLAWALIAGSGSLVAIGAVVALLVVGFDSPAASILNWLIIVGGLFTMVVCAVAAARLQDAYRRPLEARYAPPARTAPERAPVAPVRHLRPVDLPARRRPAVARSQPVLGKGKGAPMG